MRLSPRTYNDFEGRRFTVTVNKKNDTKESHLLNFTILQNAFMGNVAITIYGARDAI
jgi:hypothetical protein